MIAAATRTHSTPEEADRENFGREQVAVSDTADALQGEAWEVSPDTTMLPEPSKPPTSMLYQPLFSGPALLELHLENS